MLTFARPSRLLSAFTLVAALAAAAPAPRWCALPWSAVTAECLAACETGTRPACAETVEVPGGSCADGFAAASAVCAEAASTACDAGECGSGSACGAPAGQRAYCPEPPLAATPGPAPAEAGPPPALAVLPGTSELPEPAPAAAFELAADPPPPATRPRGLPPPVRGPPRMA